jgi:uncharacterized membrane protein
MPLSYPFSITTLGGTPNTLTLSGSGPSGLTFSFNPPTISLSANTGSTMITAQAPANLAEGTYPVTISAVGNGQIYTETLNVQVSKYLFVTLGTLYTPTNMTVPVGATVTWIRLNGPLGCGCTANAL